MKKTGFLLIILFLLVFSIKSQENTPSTGILFLTSEPIHAAVYVNGVPQPETTPLLLRNLSPGSYEIQLIKDGFLPHRGEVVIPEEDLVQTYHGALSFPFFSSRILGEDKVFLNQELLEGRSDESPLELTLPTGLYLVQREAEHLTLEPRYPRESLLKGVDFALITALLFAGGITANQIINEDALSLLTSPLALSSYGGALLLTSLDLGLRLQRRRFFRDWGRIPTETAGDQISAPEYFRRGERSIALGQLSEAYQSFTAIPRYYPESSYLPLALHRLSRINILNGNMPLAMEGFERIFKEYPHPDIFDQTCQSLAQLSARRGNWERALYYLEQMVFLDPQFSREEMEGLAKTYRARGEDNS